MSGIYAQNARGLPRYHAAVAEGKLATERGFRCNDDDRRRRAVINSIMCNSWVDLGTTQGWERELLRLRALEAEGLVAVRGSEIELTPLGRIFVRNVACVFDAYLEHGARSFSRAV